MFVQCMRLIWRPQDLMLVLLALAAMAFTIFRGLVRLLLVLLPMTLDSSWPGFLTGSFFVK